MEKKHRGRSVLFAAGGIITVFLTIAALLPFLEHVFKVEIAASGIPEPTAAPIPAEAEKLLMMAVYEMDDKNKISTAAIEIFRPGSDTVYRITIPAETKITLSAKLYKNLQAYSPELPQYLKLSNIAEGFSKEYMLTGCNRIISELLGITIEHAVSADSGQMIKWQEALQGLKTGNGFFSKYENWLEKSDSDLPAEERWIYYESYCQVENVVTEEAAGMMEQDGFMISAKQVKQRLEELLQAAGTAVQ